MPYHIKKEKNGWFVFDNSNVKLSKKPFPTKKAARKQEIAVILTENKKLKKPLSYFFG
jgi:hypothetical protein